MKTIIALISILSSSSSFAFTAKCTHKYEGNVFTRLQADCIQSGNCFKEESAAGSEAFVGLINFNAIECKTEKGNVLHGLTSSFGAGLYGLDGVAGVDGGFFYISCPL